MEYKIKYTRTLFQKPTGTKAHLYEFDRGRVKLIDKRTDRLMKNLFSNLIFQTSSFAWHLS